MRLYIRAYVFFFMLSLCSPDSKIGAGLGVRATTEVGCNGPRVEVVPAPKLFSFWLGLLSVILNALAAYLFRNVAQEFNFRHKSVYVLFGDFKLRVVAGFYVSAL